MRGTLSASEGRSLSVRETVIELTDTVEGETDFERLRKAHQHAESTAMEIARGRVAECPGHAGMTEFFVVETIDGPPLPTLELKPNRSLREK